MDEKWFERLVGFREHSYLQSRVRLQVAENWLRSKINYQSYYVGHLETPTLGELRSRAAAPSEELSGRLSVTNVTGDVREFHRDAANANALFQVASQFNLLEMSSPDVTPEDGVTRYAYDHTQGPACAIAAGAATIYRNYFVPVGDGIGQTRDRQIDCLADIGAALRNEDGELWEMRNGYALCTELGLVGIDQTLASMSPDDVDALRARLRIGLHWNVEVTDADPPRPFVSQAFCSALPVSYTRIPSDRWRAFATLVLEAAYEATLLAAILNAGEHGSNVVYLTRLGGGAFGNDPAWIHSAIRRALECVKDVNLDVRIVSYADPDPELVELAAELR